MTVVSSLTLMVLIAAWPQDPVAAEQVAEPTTMDLKGVVTVSGDARVRVTVWHNAMTRHSIEPLAETMSDDQGAFELRAVRWFEGPEWWYNTVLIVARAPGRAGLLRASSRTEPQELRIELTETVEVRGELRDYDTGEPIANAWVWPSGFDSSGRLWLTAPLVPWRAETDADGHFVLAGLPTTRHLQLVAAGTSHARTIIEVDDPSTG